MNKLSTIAAAPGPFPVSACAGRTPEPVAVVQAKDTTMHWLGDPGGDPAKHHARRRARFRKRDQGRAKHRGRRRRRSIPVLWFAMDFQGAAGTQQKAIEDRNAYLSQKALVACNPEPLRTTSFNPW